MQNIKTKFILLSIVGLFCVVIDRVDAASQDDQAQAGRLSIEQRREIITKKLENVKKSEDLNVNLLASFIAIDEKDGIEMVVDQAKLVADKEKSNILTMRHFEKMRYEGSGPERSFCDPARFVASFTDDMQESALHEAGHLVASVYHPKVLAFAGTIVPRQRALGVYIQFDRDDDRRDWTIEDVKKKIVIKLAGPVTEQVFNIHYLGILNKVWDTYIYRTDYADVELSFKELENRETAQDDLSDITLNICFLVEKRYELLGLDYNFENIENNEDGRAQYCEIFAQILDECYQQTVEFVQAHKQEIVKLAAVLYEKKYVSSDEIYEACGMTRPLLDIEKK